jgi:hypothetical protein
MPLRSVPNTIEALRLTLLKLEQTSASAEDSPHLAELKRILLQRISDLEITQALEPALADTVGVDTATLPAPASLPAGPASLQPGNDASAVTDPDLKPVG